MSVNGSDSQVRHGNNPGASATEKHSGESPNLSRQFEVGDEVELLCWKIFGTKGVITSINSSVFQHPFHVRTDRGYIVGFFQHEIRRLAARRNSRHGSS